MTQTIAPQYRGFMDAELRKSGDGRTVYGIAVPYDLPMRIDEDLTEEFAPGVADHQFNAARRVKFSRDHIPLGGILLGAAQLLRNDAAGLYGEFRVADTPDGDETLALIEANGLDQLSVGFYPRQDKHMPNGNLRRLKIDLFEVAVLTDGAYDEHAAVAGVRAAAAQNERERIVVRTGTPVHQTPGLDAIAALLRQCPPLLPIPAELVK